LREGRGGGTCEDIFLQISHVLPSENKSRESK
jgi:hypothetical protein